MVLKIAGLIINFKYEKILKADENDFNIFSILRNNTDEVNLHSRFLYEILNPAGVHHKGDLFLTLFLQTVDISDFVMDGVSVKREYKKIDICITNKNRQAIIIENKIYAEDQDKQIERYYEILKQEGFDDIKIVYLTLYGDEPNSQSMGTLENNKDKLIFTLSYHTNIDNWLEKCIKEAATFPILRETFVQYRTLIQKLTGQYHIKGYIMEIKDLLMDEKNIRLATDINQALIEAQIEIQYRFLEELSVCLEKRHGYHIQDEDKFSRTDVESYYKSSRNNKHYGLTPKFWSIQNDERLLFRIEIDWNIYYGFRVKRDDSYYNIQKEEKYDYLFKKLNKIHGNFIRDERWLGWRLPTYQFNFKNINDINVFELADAAKRKKYAEDLADEIHGIIESFKDCTRLKCEPLLQCEEQGSNIIWRMLKNATTYCYRRKN
ncbi:MAG: PD-(D/E)XK nuclease family protein [Desulfobacterales bacterium]